MQVTMNSAEVQVLGVPPRFQNRKFFKLEDEITRVEFSVFDVSQGGCPLHARFFKGHIPLVGIASRGALEFLVPGECADPRVVATYYLAYWLYWILRGIECPSKHEWEERKREIERIHYVFTYDESLKWLSKNGLIGENGEQGRWAVCCRRADMAYVPSHVQKLYEKYADKYRQVINKNLQGK